MYTISDIFGFTINASSDEKICWRDSNMRNHVAVHITFLVPEKPRLKDKTFSIIPTTCSTIIKHKPSILKHL